MVISVFMQDGISQIGAKAALHSVDWLVGGEQRRIKDNWQSSSPSEVGCTSSIEQE